MDMIFQREKLKNLLHCFHTMTGIRIGVTDPYFRMICVVPDAPHPFCQKIRRDPAVDALCQQCDRHAFHKCRGSRLEIYRCHTGLIEAASPIYGEGSLLGYLMIGQFLDDTDTMAQWENTCRALSLQEEEKQELFSDFSSLAHLSPTYIRSAAEIMKACTHAIYLENLLAIHQGTLGSRTIELIDNHLTEKLDISFLCHHLGVGKTTLCAKIRDELHVSPGELIRSRRLSAARKLLLSGNLSVTQVAEQCGFSDYNYFIRLFRQDCGLTPLAFRKQYRHTEDPRFE